MLPPPPESGVEFVRREVPWSWYESPEREEKKQAMNLGGLAVVVAGEILGTPDEPMGGLLAVIDGAGKELFLPMARYEKASPSLAQQQDPGFLSYHSEPGNAVDWKKCLLYLQAFGMVGVVERDPRAVWGPEQRSAPWATTKGATEHAWRIVFMELYDEMLKAVESFKMSLPSGDEQAVKAKGKVNIQSKRRSEGGR